jgi:tetratricopeptide (TPR) repeat protein
MRGIFQQVFGKRHDLQGDRPPAGSPADRVGAASAPRICVTNLRDISGAVFDELLVDLDLVPAELKHFCELLELRRLPAGELDTTLREMAKQHGRLKEMVRAFDASDPVIEALRQQALQALEAADFIRAESILNETSAHRVQSLAGAPEKDQAAPRLQAAAAKAANGELKNNGFAYSEAAAYFRAAVELVPGEQKGILAGYLHSLGLALRLAGDYRGAEGPLTRALAIREEILPPEHLEIASSLHQLAVLFRIQARRAEAEPRCRRALTIREKLLGRDHHDVAESLSCLAALHLLEARYAEAEVFMARALAIDEKNLGPEHIAVSTRLNNLGLVYARQKRFAEAESLYARSLAIRKPILGPDHPDVATSLNNLASVCESLNRPAEAEPLYRRSLAILERALGPEHPLVSRSLDNIGRMLRGQKRYAEAEPMYRRSLAICEKSLRPGHPDILATLGNLAGLLERTGRGAEAVPLRERATRESAT